MYVVSNLFSFPDYFLCLVCKNGIAESSSRVFFYGFYANKHTHACTHIHICTHEQTCTHMHMPHTYTHTFMHMHTHIHINADTCTCMQPDIHTHTNTSSLLLVPQCGERVHPSSHPHSVFKVRCLSTLGWSLSDLVLIQTWTQRLRSHRTNRIEYGSWSQGLS